MCMCLACSASGQLACLRCLWACPAFNGKHIAAARCPLLAAGWLCLMQRVLASSVHLLYRVTCLKDAPGTSHQAVLKAYFV